MRTDKSPTSKKQRWRYRLLQVRFAIAQPTVRIAPTKFLREKGNCTMPKLPDCDSDRVCFALSAAAKQIAS
ncbi:hypothetical protein [Anabaena sp. CCY 0017]|uniref:hypothetical protein n=1 Tax=Anabaena sp. CCY 0017 TaxID=3103866 RepID=UPI0039C63E0D